MIAHTKINTQEYVAFNYISYNYEFKIHIMVWFFKLFNDPLNLFHRVRSFVFRKSSKFLTISRKTIYLLHIQSLAKIPLYQNYCYKFRSNLLSREFQSHEFTNMKFTKSANSFSGKVPKNFNGPLCLKA